MPTKFAGRAPSQGVRNVLTISQGTQVHNKSIPGNSGARPVEAYGHVKSVEEQPELDNALVALVFGGVEAKTGAHDDGFQRVDLGKSAGLSRPCSRRPGCLPRGTIISVVQMER